METAKNLTFPTSSAPQSTTPPVAKYRSIGSVQSTWLGRFLLVSSNILTLSRALIIAPLVYLLAEGGWPTLTVVVYLLGLATDVLDGPLARTFQVSSSFGRAIDSTADKMLVFAGLLGLHGMGRAPQWLLIIFVFREFLMFGLRAIRTGDATTIGEINDSLGRKRFFVLHVGILILLMPTSLFPQALMKVGLTITAVALVIGWAALVFYVRRDFATIRTTFRNSQSGTGV